MRKLSPPLIREVECVAAGVSVSNIKRIAELLSKAAQLAKIDGVTIFGGAHSGDLRKHCAGSDRALILASIQGPFDGGDGGSNTGEDGLLRGE